MPLNKSQRDHKEDTWRPEELAKSLKGAEKDANAQVKVRTREHRGASKEQHPDDGRAAEVDDSARDGRTERQRTRRPLDPNGAEDDRAVAVAEGDRRHHRGSRARDPGDPPPGADHRTDAERRDGRRRADNDDDRRGERDDGRHQSRGSKARDGGGGVPDDDENRPRKHRDGVVAAADPESERPKHRRDDGERRRREETEAGDDEERRRRHEERRRRQRDGDAAGEGDDERRRRVGEDGGRDESGGDGGQRRRRRNDGDAAAEKSAGHRGGNEEEEDDEERRRRREERRRHRDAGGGDDRHERRAEEARRAAARGTENGADDDARDRDGERRRRRHEAAEADHDGSKRVDGGEKGRSDRSTRHREDGGEENAKERHRRRALDGDDDGTGGERERRRRTEDDETQAKRDKHSRRPQASDEAADQRPREKEERRHREERSGDGGREGGDDHRRRRRDEEERLEHEERGERRRDDREHRRKKDKSGEDGREGEPKQKEEHRGGGGRREEPQDKEHRRRRDEAGAAAEAVDRRAKAADSKGEKTREQSSSKSLDAKTTSRPAAADEVFRSRSSQPMEAADAVDEEAIEARHFRNQDVPVIKMGAANTSHNEYDEDFEEYDEDFEEAEDDSSEAKDSSAKLGNLSNREVDDLFEAMNRENDRLLAESRNSSSRDSKRGNARPEQGERTEVRPTTSRPRASYINFVSAKQREMNMQVSSRARKRGKELLQIIELDSVYVDLFEMAPVKEYELYMRSFGRTNSRQAYVQTNADCIEREIQTEEIECDTKWTQQPADDAGLFCGGGSSSSSSGGPLKKVDYSDDVVSLLEFLQRTSKVVEVLLGEERSSDRQPVSASQRTAVATTKYSFSDGCVLLGIDSVAVLKGRAVTNCCFSSSQPNMLLTGHSLPQNRSSSSETTDGGPATSSALTSCGLVCLWNVNTPQRPIKLLAAAEQPTCCCFGPLKATLVFAGMQDGSVVAWDLRSSSATSAASTLLPSSSLPPVIYPAYCTAAVMQREGHASAIAALLPVLADGRSSRAAAAPSTAGSERDSGGAGLSFQLASLEQSGVVNMWVVAEVSQDFSTLGIETAATDGSSGGGSSVAGHTDFGLAPGARIKLLRSSTVKLAAPAASVQAAVAAAPSAPARFVQPSGEPLQAIAMQLDPANSARIFIGTDVGLVLHGLRYGSGSGGRRTAGRGQQRRGYCASRPATSASGDSAATSAAAAMATGVCSSPVTAMDVSPFLPVAGARNSSSQPGHDGATIGAGFASVSASLLLVGCADGSLRLHTPLQEAPAVTLPPPPQQQPATAGGIRCALWSRGCPSVILALDESSTMHTWDLTKSDSVPIKSDVLITDNGTRRAVTFTLSEAESTAAKTRVALGFTDGSVEVHTLAPHVGTCKPGDVEQLLKYVDSL